MPRRRRAALAACGAVALLLSACSSPPDPPDPSDPSDPSAPSAPTTAPTSAPPPTATPEPAPRPGPVTVALAGDVHFEGVLRGRLDDPATALAPVRRVLSFADVAVVNLETSIGTGGRPDPSKRFTFRAPPSALAALAAAGVDVASLANNHALDFGRTALPGTFAALAAARTASPPLDVVGLGRDAAEAFRPAVTDVDGTRVAVLAATVADADPTADPTGEWAATATTPGTADAIDPDRLLRAVRAADRTADVVVAYLHWGVQGEACPSPLQRSLAADLVAAGADVVAGTHAHRLQGDGRLGPGYVAYGLGNFAWYTQGSAASSTTGVLTLTVSPPADPSGRARVTRADWTPALVGADGLPLPTPAARTAFEAGRADLRACSGLAR